MSTSILAQLAASNAVKRIRRGANESLTPEHIHALKCWAYTAGFTHTQMETFLGVLESHEHIRIEKLLVNILEI